jgi:hypothetical protein
MAFLAFCTSFATWGANESCFTSPHISHVSVSPLAAAFQVTMNSENLTNRNTDRQEDQHKRQENQNTANQNMQLQGLKIESDKKIEGNQDDNSDFKADERNIEKKEEEEIDSKQQIQIDSKEQNDSKPQIQIDSSFSSGRRSDRGSKVSHSIPPEVHKLGESFPDTNVYGTTVMNYEASGINGASHSSDPKAQDLISKGLTSNAFKGHNVSKDQHKIFLNDVSQLSAYPHGSPVDRIFFPRTENDVRRILADAHRFNSGNSGKLQY